jgi:hypothetical protein
VNGRDNEDPFSISRATTDALCFASASGGFRLPGERWVLFSSLKSSTNIFGVKNGGSPS